MGGFVLWQSYYWQIYLLTIHHACTALSLHVRLHGRVALWGATGMRLAADFHCFVTKHKGGKQHRKKSPRLSHLLWLALNLQHFLLSFPVDLMRLDRQKMLSFSPCVTTRANSITLPYKEEGWNCVMAVGALNLVMILSRGKWSHSLDTKINSFQSTRCSWPHPLTPILLAPFCWHTSI